jgi:TonB family protein
MSAIPAEPNDSICDEVGPVEPALVAETAGRPASKSSPVNGLSGRSHSLTSAKTFAGRAQQWLASDPRNQRAASIGFAILANAVMFVVLVSSAGTIFEQPASREIQAFLIQSQQADRTMQPEMQKPDFDLVPAPDIQIAQEPEPDAPTQIDSVSMSQILAPRPDPAHHNQPPALANLSSEPLAISGSANLVLKILVMPDGSVADAQVTSSSGQAQLDILAIRFVKANWRYLPATIAGRAIQYWTTVLVPIRPA